MSSILVKACQRRRSLRSRAVPQSTLETLQPKSLEIWKISISRLGVQRLAMLLRALKLQT